MKNFVLSFVLGASFLGASLGACSSSDTSADGPSAGGGDAGDAATTAPPRPSDAGVATTADASDGAAGCNSVANAGGAVLTSTVMAAAPAPTGGTIADGTYHQTEFTIYDPVGPASAPEASAMKATLVISGNVMNLVMDLGDGEDRTFTESFTVAGTALNRVLSCPKQGPDLDAVYSASASTLTIYETDPQSKLVAGSVYVKH